MVIKRFTSKRRFKFRKISGRAECDCWYCNKKTAFALYDLKKGSEIWCCSKCALKYGKIKRLSDLIRKYPIRRKTTKKIDNPCVKKIENSNIGRWL